MRVLPAPLEGLSLLELDAAVDERGSFSRVWDAGALTKAGLRGRLDSCNVSRNPVAGTLRGMHWQSAPHEESKLVSCVRGRVFDVAVDVRTGSATFLQWWGLELSPAAGRALYVPVGFAHGFLTLEDDCDVLYVMTADYSPEHARGLRYDDPAVGIRWPAHPTLVSARDRDFPLVRP